MIFNRIFDENINTPRILDKHSGVLEGEIPMSEASELLEHWKSLGAEASRAELEELCEYAQFLRKEAPWQGKGAIYVFDDGSALELVEGADVVLRNTYDEFIQKRGQTEQSIVEDVLSQPCLRCGRKITLDTDICLNCRGLAEIESRLQATGAHLSTEDAKDIGWHIGVIHQGGGNVRKVYERHAALFDRELRPDEILEFNLSYPA
jgi:hypothetical protein